MTRLFSLLLIILIATGSASSNGQVPTAPLPWSREDAEALAAFVEQIGSEGLDPADYEPDRLRALIASNDAALASIATSTFLHLVTDLRQGHVRGSHRIAWHIPDPAIDRPAQQAMLVRALATHSVSEMLGSLLPHHPEYVALKATLAATPFQDRAAVERLRANLERWRWMPHDLGTDYILVNVAGFELQLVRGGKTISRHKLIVGKTSTPTPQFSTRATGLILNPWWDIPQSIVAESVGRLVRTNPAGARSRGYVWSGGHYRQSPGPGNALGQMKLVMPNPFTVYIHDTPSKSLFDEKTRAFSHGCIRAQDPFALAALLLASNPGWDRAAIDRVVASRASTRVDFARSLPVYVTYFTAATDESGAIAVHPDIYGRDKAVVAQLTDAEVTKD
ncbi:L,D-transpeptidase family protein [Sphingosinicella rhizophila]|uniref:L,D-transpeptidase family protein n=1 Tax=Sphingosinicella rhizophila TaxID=3050082 RepID=A0ABU3Q6H8_9SPHN|nr:L,D-transpeptidase family protein [Sphingosinicella sp. GR2756]MDT9599004.1 L,D-transpeptidase family protein [Sphingosinicella sp. GR2756]